MEFAEAVICVQLNPMVKELSLYDVMGTPGVACDISHCNTRALAKVRLLDRLISARSTCDDVHQLMLAWRGWVAPLLRRI